MKKRDPDLDRLEHLLEQCLGRIDAEAYRIQDLPDGDDGYETADAVEQETAMLQDLVDHMLVVDDQASQAALNPIVERATQACVTELGVPIVVRQRLDPDLPPVAVSPNELTHAVRRALVLAVEDLDAGGELIVTTRRDDDVAVFEIESRGLSAEAGPFRGERAETLGDFVGTFDGRCRVATDDHHGLLLVLELPMALATDER